MTTDVQIMTSEYPAVPKLVSSDTITFTHRPSYQRHASSKTGTDVARLRPSLRRSLSSKTGIDLPKLKSQANAKKEAFKLLLWEELEEWQRMDTHIQSGYRKATPSLLGCLQSWFYLHNETVNIFSHLIGYVIFTSLVFILYTELSPHVPPYAAGDIIAISIFLLGLAICFGLSASFHTFASHSFEGYHFARHLDFLGIIVLVLGTSAPQVFYTFYDNPSVMTRYWIVITLFGIFASVSTFHPAFAEQSGNAARVAVFAGLGLSTFLPVVHGIWLHGVEDQSFRFPLEAVAITHSFNIFGAIVYVSHFPERWWPKTFDIFGASHQLMHCAIVGAALTLLWGTLKAFDNRNGAGLGL